MTGPEDAAAAAAVALLAESALCYRLAAQSATVDGRPDAANLFRSIADEKTGHVFAVIGEVRDPAGTALALRLTAAAECRTADWLEQQAATIDDNDIAALFVRIAAATRAQAARLAEHHD